MNDTASDTLEDLIQPVDAGAHVTGTAFLGEAAIYALGDGTIVRVGADGTERFDSHPGGAVLTMAANAVTVLTGGDDGRVVALEAGGQPREIGRAAGNGWIDALAITPTGAMAWASGRHVTARDEKGWSNTIEAASTVRGLVFGPKGFQLALAHYDGATVWFPRTVSSPKSLTWKGSHIGITWSPDARFIITAMQENALHGWRIADATHMRMTGYPGKTHALSWSPDGKWLATSGATAVIVWPFVSRDGPMGKMPQEVGEHAARVTHVVFHPTAPVMAAGYADGAILLLKLEGGGRLSARNADGAGAITALSWDKTGMRLAFGTENGQAGILPLPQV